jgi:hypothetical protein
LEEQADRTLELLVTDINMLASMHQLQEAAKGSSDGVSHFKG